MKIDISKSDINKLKSLKNTKIDYYLSRVDDMSMEDALDFMEFLYDKANESLEGNDYKETETTRLLERIADYLYEKTND